MAQKDPNVTLTSLVPQIEIFRAGRHIDDAGTAHSFSEADVAAMVASYDPALREAPLTIGHPAGNLPAYGWVKGLALNGVGKLVMDTHQVQPQFAEMVDAKMFKKRSASFYTPTHPNNPKPGNWYLRHVAFLGAQPPAIAGLADFAEGDSTGTVNFSETLFNQEQLRMSEELKQQLSASQAQAAAADAARTKAEGEATEARAQLAQFAEAAKLDRVAGYTSFCEAQIKTGCLLPKEKDAAIAMMTTLGEAKAVSFAEGGATKTVPAVDFLKDLIARAKPVVSFGEHAAGGTVPGAGSAAGLSEAEMHNQALAYARHHAVNYSEAIKAVATSFTS